MIPLSFNLNVRAVKEGLILWSDYYGTLEVYTQGLFSHDLIFQGRYYLDFTDNPYDFILHEYDKGTFYFEEGDD